MLKINDLSFKYQNDYIIQNFTEEFHSGENIMLLGDNGSGKSTFGKLICGIIQASRGSLTINGVNPYDKKAPARIESAYYISQINQLQFLFGNLEKEIKLIEKLSNKKLLSQEYQAFYLPEDLETNPFELSVNEAWRFSLLGAIIIKPVVLFIDELPSAVNERNLSSLKYVLEHRKAENKITFLSYQRMVNLRFDKVLQVENQTIFA